MKRSERGFALVEILVVMAIVALIGSAASMATSQVITGTKRSNDHMTAIRQVQNAGYWISRDVLMAQSIAAGDDPETAEIVEFITLNWTDWDEGKKKDSKYHLVTYSFEDMADGIGKLKRQYLIYEDGKEKGNEVTLIAEYIYYDPDNPASSSFSPEPDGRWILTIQARKGTATETREYEVDPRVNMQRLMQ